MTRSILFLGLLLCTLGAAAGPAQDASTSEGKPKNLVCQIDPLTGDISCPHSKAMVRDNAVSSPYQISVNNPVPVMMVCDPSGGGVICEGWAQEVSTPKQLLTYSWAVRVGYETTVYGTGHEPYVGFSCYQGQSVRVTMRLSNGSFTGTSTQHFVCGNETQ